MNQAAPLSLVRFYIIISGIIRSSFVILSIFSPFFYRNTKWQTIS